MSVSQSHYYLRSKSDKHIPSTSPSPQTPPMDIIHNPDTAITDTATHSRKRKLRPRRKRRFSQITDANEDIDLHTHTPHHRVAKRAKKSKLSRTIKFTLGNNSNQSSANNNNKKIKRIRLTFKNKPKHTNNTKQNCSTVTTREVSLSANSPVILNKHKRTVQPRIESYEIPLAHNGIRMQRRNPYICCYSFFEGYTIGITPTLGAITDVKHAIQIFSQELVSGRAKASVQTRKNACLVYIKTRKGKLVGCGILHIDHVWKRVNIEMFAVDMQWRGNGFASMMVYLIQYRMLYYDKYDLFVCAANEAIPFWSNRKYNFLYAHKGILEQHEVEDEKHGGTRHLIWYGTPIQARCALLKCFKQTD